MAWETNFCTLGTEPAGRAHGESALPAARVMRALLAMACALALACACIAALPARALAESKTASLYIGSGDLSEEGITKTYTGTIEEDDLWESGGTLTVTVTNESLQLAQISVKDTDTSTD